MSKQQLIQQAEQIRDEYRIGANSAERVGNALLAIIHALSEADVEELSKFFLRKDREDTAKELITLLNGAEFGDFIDSISHGKGGVVDALGNAQFESVKVRGVLESLVTIYNQLQAIKGDQVFTESSRVDDLVAVDEDTYRLYLYKETETDFIAFKEGDILRGSVRSISNETQGGMSWVRVLNTNQVDNTATVVMYPNEEVPSGVNLVPTKHMILHRWGNAVDKSRQTTWYLSSTEGRIMFLNGVTKPILEESNYSAFWGKPIKLKAFEDKPINYEQPYFYARGALIQDLIRVDYMGQVVKEIIDAGLWQQGKEYKNGEKYPYQQHDVWLGGNRWRCLINNSTDKPRWNSPCWIPIGGNQLLRMKLTNTHGTLFRPGQVHTSFIASVYYGDIDITADIEPLDWQWLRETSNPNADLAWIEAHKEATNQIEITDKDIDPNYRNQTRFICKAYVRLRDEITELRKDIIV